MTGHDAMPRLGRRAFLAGSLALGFAAAGAEQAAGGQGTPVVDKPLAALEAFIVEAMDRLLVPGAAIGIVRGDVVILQGFGTRTPGERTPVTPDTLLMVDSLTKPLTTSMAATLVDGGALRWDIPVTDLLPDFTLADAEDSRRMSVGDLFCNCSGVPRNDAEILFNAEEITPRRLIAMAANLPITAGIGETFQYSNHMFAIGGYAAAVAAGTDGDDLRSAYQRAMRKHVLDPAGMTQSTFSMVEAQDSGNYATPVAPTLTGEVQRLSLGGEEAFADAVEPAGGLWSSAREMTRFLQTQLNSGVSPDGVRVVSDVALRETWRARVAVPPNPLLPPPLAHAFRGYGLGWYVGEYAGQRMVSHDGGVSGFVSRLAMLPEAGIGVVVLTNGGAGAQAFALATPFRLFELLLGTPPVVEDLLRQQIAARTAQTEEIRATLGEISPDAVSPFLGRYASPELGEMRLSLDGSQLNFYAGEVHSELVPQLNAEGQTTAYLFVAPPLASLPISVSLSETMGGQPEVRLEVAGEGAPAYAFTPVAAATGTPVW